MRTKVRTKEVRVRKVRYMFKKYYISSKLRFSLFVTIMVLIAIMSISAMFNTAYASGKGNYAITVESGDTLWTIATKYSGESTDIRKFIYEISDLNGLDTSDIFEGQKLLIPA